ncbi:MAG: DUF4276 family protein [Magnetococcales bacterium]|nr:DUF4276 family protein [Magnetococcales bacterium]
MRFEILVEGQADQTMLSILMERILGPFEQPHRWYFHKHRGIGKIQEDPTQPPNKHDPTLLHNLPSKLRAYGKDMGENEAVVVLVDLDDRPDCRVFKSELTKLLNTCPKPPQTLLRIATEETEAWFFGDKKALLAAYPEANTQVIDHYVQDSQCGTWEKLADAIYPGGSASLIALGKRSPRVMEQKRVWAKKIAPEMNVERNQSPSFRQFRDGLRRFIGGKKKGGVHDRS